MSLIKKDKLISVIDKFEKIAHDLSTDAAIVFETGESVEYGKLNELANAIGLTILSHTRDSSEDVFISVMMDRHLGLIAALLAVLKAGAAYVPVDPSFPPDRQSYIFSHSKCQILIADQSSHQQAKSLGVDFPAVVLVVDELGVVVEQITSYPQPEPITNGDEESLRDARQPLISRPDGGLQYVLYTSGSTGKPKGVMVTLRGVSNVVEWFATELRVVSGCRVLGLTTVCFDISGLEIFLPLTRGGALVFVKSSTQKDPFHLLDVVAEMRVSIVQATPTTYEMMLATGWKGDMDIDFLVGGEAFRPSLLSLIGTCKSFRNVYGPTETTIWSSCHLMDKSRVYEGSIPIGCPISETTFYLLQDDDSPQTGTEPMPFILAAEEGELLIGGAGVARGYMHAPDITAQRFIKNPFGDGNVYRTGDVVRRLPDGNYVFVRRIDDQVKVDGFRIELGEIESVYGADPLVEQAVVLVRAGQLVAYIKPKKERKLSPEDISNINNIAFRSLTHYMQPKSVVVVEEFPHTANGKLDRKALPDPIDEEVPPVISNSFDFQSVDSEDHHSMENHVITIIKKMRQVDVKWYSSFSHIAVDSLSAVMFVHLLSESLDGIRINPQEIYAAGVTVRSFATELYDRLNVSDTSQILIRLGIDCAYSTMDLETGDNSSPEDPSEVLYETKYSSAIMSNSRLLIGLRGFVAFMVLWDHYHPKFTPSGVYIRVPVAWQADNFLFVILSGVTTALQLREPIVITKDAAVQPRGSFNISSFLYSRFVGIFPVFWLALLFNAPRWYLQNVHFSPHPTAFGVCTFLYPIGLQTYYSSCKLIGPRDLFYPSALWIAFIYYSILRHILTRVIDYLVQALPMISPWMICYAYGRPSHRIMVWIFGITMSCVILLLCFIASSFPDEINTGHRFFAYFLAGAVLSYLVGGFHFYLNYEMSDHIRSAENQMLMTRDDSLKHLKIDSAAGNPGPMSFVVYFSVVLFDPYVTLHNCIERYSFNSLTQRLRIESFQSLLWKLSPDLAALCWALLLSPFDELRNNFIAKSTIRWIAVPVAAMLFTAISILQPPRSQMNVSRFFFESPIMNFMGYITYPLYLLQQVVFEFYARVIKDDIDENVFPITASIKKQKAYDWSLTNSWFNRQPLDLKFYGMLCFIAICWVIQKYFQDGLFMYGVARLNRILLNLKSTPKSVANSGRKDDDSAPKKTRAIQMIV